MSNWDNDAVQSDADAQAALSNAGYTDVTGLAHHGRVWVGQATNAGGATVDVVVHGKDGRVDEES